MINAGKANMHELSFGTMSKNVIFGAARSALDYKRSAGGSSGGSGGAVGLGTVPIALGTDTGGSIRIPASSNGIYGYRPTIDRWPAADYGMKLSHARDSIGPLALSLRDIVLMDSLITGDQHSSDINPRDIRIGIPSEHFYDDLDPIVASSA